MHALDLEVETERDLTPDKPLPSGVHTPRHASGDAEAEHFSPDPHKRTDRYRLVTPFSLPPLD